MAGSISAASKALSPHSTIVWEAVGFAVDLKFVGPCFADYLMDLSSICHSQGGANVV